MKLSEMEKNNLPNRLQLSKKTQKELCRICNEVYIDCKDGKEALEQIG